MRRNYWYKRAAALTLALTLTVGGAAAAVAAEPSPAQVSAAVLRNETPAVPAAGVQNRYPASAMVGVPYKEKILAFEDGEYTRNLSFTCTYRSVGAAEDTVLKDALPFGLSFDRNTGIVSGTPTQSGVLSLSFDVSWDGSQKVPAFVSNHDVIKIKIVPNAAAEEPLTEEPPAEPVMDPVSAYVPTGREETVTVGEQKTCRSSEPAYFTFVSPCLKLNLSYREGDALVIYDKNGIPVDTEKQSTKNGSVTDVYRLSAGAAYYLSAAVKEDAAESASGGAVFTLAPDVPDVSGYVRSSNAKLPEVSIAEPSAEEEENITEVDGKKYEVWHVSGTSSTNIGLLDYGYMYSWRNFTVIAPYKVLFTNVKAEFTGPTDRYSYSTDQLTRAEKAATLRSGEVKTGITLFHYLTSNAPVHDGTSVYEADILIPYEPDEDGANLNSLWVDSRGILRDSSVEENPEDEVEATSVKLSSKSGSIAVNWTEVSKAASYQVFRWTDGADGAVIATIKDPHETSYQDKDLESGKKYTYRIRTYGESGLMEDYSDSDAVSKYFLAAPKKIGVKSSEKGKLTIRWASVKGAKGYEVWYVGSGCSKIRRISGASKTTCTVTGLKSKKRFRIYIRTVNGSNKSAWSKAKSVKIK